jgi:methyl-galactoside transport system substrate-binding protein
MDKNGDGILQYVLVQGNISQQDAIYRTKAIDDSFATWNTDGSMKNERLDIQEAGWNTTKAKELMETWIVKYGNKIEAVVCNNDAMAMGVIEALRGGGYYDDPSKKVWVYGINALPQVWSLLENGELAGTVLTSPWLQAIAAVDISIDAVNGREPLAASDFEFEWSGPSGREIRCMDYAVTVETIGDAEEAYGNCS